MIETDKETQWLFSLFDCPGIRRIAQPVCRTGLYLITSFRRARPKTSVCIYLISFDFLV